MTNIKSDIMMPDGNFIKITELFTNGGLGNEKK